jgi:hypothetical protein
MSSTTRMLPADISRPVDSGVRSPESNALTPVREQGVAPRRSNISIKLTVNQRGCYRELALFRGCARGSLSRALDSFRLSKVKVMGLDES